MFNKRVKIIDVLKNEQTGYEVTVMGWVRNFRQNQFIDVNDGSTNSNIQVVATLGNFKDELLKRITTGACIKAVGEVLPSTYWATAMRKNFRCNPKAQP